MQKIPLRHGPGLSAQARSDGKAASGRVGAQEPGYGRPPGECPPELGYGQPNRHGPEYEEGGRYPGARLDDSPGVRALDENLPLRSRSADPGQGSYGGFFGENPAGQRQVIDGDARVGEIVREQLRHSGYDVSQVSVDVHQGCVRLDGVVPDGRTRHGVEHCADTCVGVRNVENHTRVARPEVPGAPGSPRH